MSDQILRPGDEVALAGGGAACTVSSFLGGGTQGDVYAAEQGGQPVALKWYHPHYLPNDPGLRARIETALQRGAPSERFLWPMAIATSEDYDGFGYVMPLRDARFRGFTDLMAGKLEVSFRALATAGYALADSYLQLHAKGLCYRDINFANLFLDPDSGEVLVCDNDNVDVNGAPGAILGTPGFMAPEIVRGEALPSTGTDLYSLAVLLFYMFCWHHPLSGRREWDCLVLDEEARLRLHGTDPLFIFDPDDTSNAPVPGGQDAPLTCWALYPQFLRALFTRAFTSGLRDPAAGRVLEGEWRAAMVRLRDAIVYCAACGAQCFYDVEAARAGAAPAPCYGCKEPVAAPPRVRIGNAVVVLNHDTQLFPHHVDARRRYDFSAPWAEVTRHPQDPARLGLRNVGPARWVATLADGRLREVEPGRSVALAAGTRVDFGRGAEGTLRL